MKYFIILGIINLFICANVIEIQINEEVDFHSAQKEFKLEYSNSTNKDSIFILFYEQKNGLLQITITYPNSQEKNFIILEANGNIYFPFTKDGNYLISFLKLDEEDPFEGKFKIITTEKNFTLDSNKDISFDNIRIRSASEPCPIIFSLENKSNKNYMKKIQVINERSKIYVSENGSDFRKVNDELMYFNKNTEYLIKLEFMEFYDGEQDEHFYIILDFSISNFEYNLAKIEDFSVGTKLNKNLKYLFIKVNLKDNNKFYVRTDDDFKFAYIDNEEQYNYFPNGIQYLKFNDSLINAKFEKFEKPENKDYMIIFIEFKDQEKNLVYFAKEVIVELNKEMQFDAENMLFKFNYEKKNSEKSLFCLFSEFNNESEEKIDLLVFNESMNLGSKSINFSIDSFNFLVEHSGDYFILLTSLGTIIGNFKIVSSEYEFSIDANKELYFHNDYKFELEFQSILTFTISNIDKSYEKLYSSIYELRNIISYKKNKKENEEFLPMKSRIFLYEKGDSIIIKLNLRKIYSPDYLHISNIDKNISYLDFNNYKLPNSINKIFKINYLDIPYFKIEGDDSNRYYISYVDKERYDAIETCLEEIIFNNDRIKDNIYIKPVNADYGILIVETVNKIINTDLTISKLDSPIKELNFDSEEIFNIFYSKFQLEYEKKGETKEMLIFIYKMSLHSNNFGIKITGPNNYVKTEEFDNEENIEIYAFENGETGKYEILFSSENFEGTFKIVKASDPIKININENIKLNKFNTTFELKPIILEFKDEYLRENEGKEFLMGENNKDLNLIQISTDGSEFKNLNSSYYIFEEKKEYKIKIEYNDLGNGQYKFEQFIMSNFGFNLENFFYGYRIYRNHGNYTEIQFIKIDLSKFSKIVVKSDNDSLIRIKYYNDDLDWPKIFNDFLFEDLKYYNNTITNEFYKKAILMIILEQGEIKIDFSDGNEKNQDDEDNTVFIILGIAGGVLLLLSIIFLIYRCRKRKSAETDIIGSEDKREELMPQID